MPTTERANEMHSESRPGHGTQSPFLTVFTPTYNRDHTLPRVYDSLRGQTSLNFEWVIIDDGSSDGTEPLVKSWIDEAPFRIRYFRQENGGKHIAWNHALSMARGHYFVCLDSDDAYAPHAVTTLESDLMPRFGGTEQVDARAFLLMDPDGNPFGRDLAESDFRKTFSELVLENKLPSDVWIVFRTEILRQFPFPEKFRNIYFPESWVIRRFDRAYPIRFAHNQRLGFYYRDMADTKSNSLSVTLSRLKSGSALTLYLMHLSLLNDAGVHFRSHPLKFAKSGINYIRFRNWAGKGLGPFVWEIEPFYGKMLAILGIIPGYLLCLVDRLRIMIRGFNR
jgi:glycosyltransferase involved in cell wall biosynthesis